MISCCEHTSTTIHPLSQKLQLGVIEWTSAWDVVVGNRMQCIERVVAKEPDLVVAVEIEPSVGELEVRVGQLVGAQVARRQVSVALGDVDLEARPPREGRKQCVQDKPQPKVPFF